MSNDEMSYELKHWGIGAGVAGVIIALVLLASPYVVYEDDPYQMVRYAIQHIIIVLLALITLSGVILFLDWITDYDLLDKIGENPMATSFFVVGVVLCITILFVYA